MARISPSRSVLGSRCRLAFVAVLSLILFGCDALLGSGETDSPPAAKERSAKQVLDAFTLSARANGAFVRGELHLTDEGRKYYREASPEAGYPVDERGIMVPTEFVPSRWEAYLCLEMEAVSTEPSPAKPVVAIEEMEDGTRFQFVLEAISGNPCYPYDIPYISGKGFRVVPPKLAVGTLTIEYR